jgi:Spy/CpxP family protein refolding chaperone
MRRSLAIASIAGIFLVGALVGALGTHVFYAHHFRHPGFLSALGTRWLAADLHRRLDLTAEQQRQVEAILADTRREALDIRHQMMPRITELMARTHERISRVLTPAQRTEFEKYHAERHDHIKRFIAGGR